MAMSRKCFAAIKSGQEAMREIMSLTQNSGNCDICKAVNQIAEKWNKDFADCDPAWQPQAAEDTTAKAIALGAFVQS